MDHSNQGSHLHHITFIILQASFPCFLILPGHVPGHVVEVSLEVTGTISSSRRCCAAQCAAVGARMEVEEVKLQVAGESGRVAGEGGQQQRIQWREVTGGAEYSH